MMNTVINRSAIAILTIKRFTALLMLCLLKTTCRTRELPRRAMGKMMAYNTVKTTCNDTVFSDIHMASVVPFSEMKTRQKKINNKIQFKEDRPRSELRLL